MKDTCFFSEIPFNMDFITNIYKKRIFFFFFFLVILEYQILNRMLSKSLFRVVYESQYKSAGVPVFTMGYRVIKQESLVKILKRESYQCRSLRLNLSYSGHHVYHEIQMYCERDPRLLKIEPRMIIDLFQKEVNSSNSINSTKVKFVEYRDKKKSFGKNFHLLIMSILFAVVLCLALPFNHYLKIEDL